MFKLDLSPGYEWPIKFRLLNEQGVYEECEFKAVFKRLPQPRIAEIVGDAFANKSNDRQLVDEVLIGWNGVLNADESECAFTEENKQKLFDVAIAPNQEKGVFSLLGAIVKAWFDSRQEAELKN